MKLRNTNPLGQVDVPLLGRQGEPFGQPGSGCLEPGEEFDVTEDQARALLPQEGNFTPVDDEAQHLLSEMQLNEEKEFPGTGEPNAGVQTLPGQTVEIEGTEA